MRRFCLAAIILFVSVFFLPELIPSQEYEVPSTIPEQLRRPLRTEAPRFPRDRVIGELGQGTAPDGAWRYAQGIGAFFIRSSVSRNLNSSLISTEDSDFLRVNFPVMETFEPRTFHLGGGRTEIDGSVSFLIRFLGREEWIAGELYLHMVGANWRLDELVLEELRTMEEGRSSYTFEFSPYERFF